MQIFNLRVIFLVIYMFQKNTESELLLCHFLDLARL